MQRPQKDACRSLNLLIVYRRMHNIKMTVRIANEEAFRGMDMKE
jgi:hypothetical protein